MTGPAPVARPVVVGVDGSRQAEHAALWGAAEAASRAAPLHLVTATGGDGPTPRRARRILDEAAATVTARVPGAGTPHVEAVEGEPAEVLADASCTAALVVVGHRDLTRVASLRSGSVAMTMTGRSGCPLVILPAAGPPEPDVGTRPIVVGVDGTASGDPAVAFAFAQAALHHAPLVAVHAAPARERWAVPLPDLFGTGDMSRRLVVEELDAWCRNYPGVALDQVFTGADPAGELLARSADAQMLVVGSRGLNGVQGLLLGSVSQELLLHVGCPLAVVREEADPDMP